MFEEEYEKIQPMLAKIGTIKDLKKKSFIYELFLGGTRCLVYKREDHIRLLNRKGNWIEFRYPEFFELNQFIDAKNVIIDGELVVFDAEGNPSFGALETREHASAALEIEILSKKTPATFVAFDIIMKNNRWYNDRPLFERKKLLEETIKENTIMKKAKWTKNGAELFREAKKQKIEGVIGKNVNSRYEFGVRSENLLRINALKTLDCVVVGWKEKGDTGFFSSLALGIYKELHLYFMGTVDAFSEEFIERWQPRLNTLKQKKPPVRDPPEGFHWLKPSLVCEIEYEEITKKLELKKPKFIRMRSDKDPTTCTITEQVKLK